MMKRLFSSFKRLAGCRLLPTAFCLLFSAFCLLPTVLHAQVASVYITNTTQVLPFGTTNANAPTVLAFGALPIGTASGTQTLTLTNTGSASLSTITLSFSGGNTGDFGQTSSPATNCGTPLTAGSSCTITVTFTPAAAGVRTSALSIASNVTTQYYGVTGVGTGYAGGCVLPAAATLTPTAAQKGCLILMGATSGEVVTLPVPVIGLAYDFVITVTNTSASNEIRTDSSSTFLLGNVQHCSTGIACLDFWADGSATQALKMAGTGSSGALGGYIGSRLHVEAISATQWEISGTNECVATCTTAFNATP